MSKKLLIFPVLALGLCSCASNDKGHFGTPSDPNEQAGNPNARPENSQKPVSNSQDPGDKAGKDPHTFTPDNTIREKRPIK